MADSDTNAIDLHRLWHLLLLRLYGALRFRWIGLAAGVLVAVAGWIVVLLLPSKYEATAQVYVDTEGLLRPLLKGLSIENNTLNYVSLVSQTLITRPNLERVARGADLDLSAKTPREFDAVLMSLEQRIKITSNRDNVFTIAFADVKRDRAIDIVNRLLGVFVDDSLGSGQRNTAEAETTLDSEIKGYEQRLNEAEERLKEFKRRNVGLMPDEQRDYYAQLQAATSGLADVRQQIRVASEKRDTLERQLKGAQNSLENGDATGSSALSGSFDAQIRSLETRRADLLVEFTDKHPEVVRVSQMIAELRERRREQLAAMSDPGSIRAGGLEDNPIYQNLKIQQSTVEIELASLRAALADRQSKVDRLKKLVDVIPQVEAEYNRLNRDYDVVKSRYTQMVARMEDLQTGKRVDSSSEQIKFRIISPPYAPVKSDGPPRSVFALAAGIFGIVVGAAAAVILDLLNPVLQQSSQLSAFEGVVVLGTIRRVPSKLKDWRSLIPTASWFAAAGVFALAMAMIVTFATPLSDLVRGLALA